MVKVDVKYTGNLHCDATHGPSESKISTDAPTDNKGKGEAFSPTDLVATALATCMSTTMGIKAEELGVDLRGMIVSVQKEMSKDCAAPDRGPAIRDSHPAPARFAASRSARANRAQLPGAQKPSAGNSSPDKIFLGRIKDHPERSEGPHLRSLRHPVSEA